MPGRPGTDYFYPSKDSIDYFAGKGANVIRLPFRWERVQPRLGEDLDRGEVGRIDAVVKHATASGLAVVLDVHNYARYRGLVIGAPELPIPLFADLWARLASRYAANDKVIFGLMNEPSRMSTEAWLAAAIAAIGAIRQAGAGNLILVPGNGWSGAHSWLNDWYGTPNATAMLDIVDPAGRIAYEVHQYLDDDSSGTSPECRHPDVGVRRLTAFTEWARAHGKQAFLGEFGVGSDATCLAALARMLGYMAQNSDVWLGWAYWAAGPWGRDYFTSLQPLDGADRPQMAVLVRHLSAAEQQP